MILKYDDCNLLGSLGFSIMSKENMMKSKKDVLNEIRDIVKE